jgi:hypothetical protein
MLPILSSAGQVVPCRREARLPLLDQVADHRRVQVRFYRVVRELPEFERAAQEPVVAPYSTRSVAAEWRPY